MEQAVKKPIAEHCRVFDLGALKHRGTLRQGFVAVDELRWNDGWSLDYEVNAEDASALAIRLTYTVAETGEYMDYSVPLETAHPRCGGIRFFMSCPMDRDGRTCGRRVQKLYLPPANSVFGCKTCYDLAYESRNDRKAAALARAQKIRQLLGGDSNVLLPFPRKPPGMWTSTYDRLRQKAEAAEAAYDLAFDRKMKQLDRMIEVRRREIGG